MNFDDEDLDLLEAKGRKINGRSKPAPKGDEPEVKLLQKILHAIESKETHIRPVVNIPEQKAPVVNVSPAPVTVQPYKPITKWRFTLTKDKAGHTTEIIATAIQ